MLGAFSVLYTINIAVSNISLQLVTVPVSQLLPNKRARLTFLSSTRSFELPRRCSRCSSRRSSFARSSA